MSLITGRYTPGFAKDTVYRFMKMIQINWICFTTILSSRIIKDAIIPLDSKDRASVLIINDSMFERNRSKKVELLAKVYDHAKHKYHSVIAETGQTSSNNAEKWIDLIKDYAEIEELDATMLNTLIKEIVVHEDIDEEGNRNISLEIHYNFRPKDEGNLYNLSDYAGDASAPLAV